jgi:hypothetical protein
MTQPQSSARDSIPLEVANRLKWPIAQEFSRALQHLADRYEDDALTQLLDRV